MRLGPEDSFPAPNTALTEPNGLLAIGGDLSIPRLLQAYRLGIFPWYDQEPILWWCPDPRTVLFLDSIHISKSLDRILKKKIFSIKVDENFQAVIQACAAPRKKGPETWITPAMQAAYIELHNFGYAHCIEVYQDQELIGGLYGVSLGHNFFGESMFSLRANASKFALVYLVNHLKNWGFEWIDCQVNSDHLMTMGATEIPRQLFLEKIALNNKFETKIGKWQYHPNLV